MIHHHEAESARLFPTPVEAVSMNLRWEPSTGWHVAVFHHHGGDTSAEQCGLENYERLSFREALDVIEVSVFELLPWLGEQRRR